MPRGKRVTAKDCRVFLERIAAGDTAADAAVAAGQQSPNPFYNRANKDSLAFDPVFEGRLVEAMQERAALMADRVDEKVNEWIDDPEIGDTIRIAWMRRHNPAYREKQQVEHTGTSRVEVTVEHDFGSLLDKAEHAGLIRRGPAAALDAAPEPVLPARTD